MLATPELTPQQIESFERDGFVIVPGLFAGQAGLLQQWATELAALPEEPGRQWVYHEPSRLDPEISLISRIEYISPFHEGFATLAEVLKAPVAQLLGEPAMLFKEKVNYKMPGGDGFRPHQDAQAGWERYADYFVSVMVCIDEATIENGCLQFATGDYPRHSVVREWEPLTDEDMAGLEWKHYPTRPGDVAFFDSYVPHGSEPNLTEQTRRLYFATYNRASAGDHLQAYYADKHRSYPPDIEREAGKEYVFRV